MRPGRNSQIPPEYWRVRFGGEGELWEWLLLPNSIVIKNIHSQILEVTQWKHQGGDYRWPHQLFGTSAGIFVKAWGSQKSSYTEKKNLNRDGIPHNSPFFHLSGCQSFEMSIISSSNVLPVFHLHVRPCTVLSWSKRWYRRNPPTRSGKAT